MHGRWCGCIYCSTMSKWVEEHLNKQAKWEPKTRYRPVFLNRIVGEDFSSYDRTLKCEHQELRWVQVTSVNLGTFMCWDDVQCDNRMRCAACRSCLAHCKGGHDV